MDHGHSILYRFRWRNVLRVLIRSIPEKIRFRWYRKFVLVADTLPDDVTVEVARTKEDLEAAFKILHDEYVRLGLMKPHPSGMRITPYHLLPSTSTIVVKKKGEVIATISVIRDSELGFPLERIIDTRSIRKYGNRLAELSSLAIKKEHRENRGAYLFPLLKFTYNYCVKFFGVDYTVIAVHPSHMEFYRAIMFFELFPNPDIKNYSFVEGALAVGGYLSLREAYKKFMMHYGELPDVHNLFRYFTGIEIPNLKYPNRAYYKISDPVLSPDLIRYFFVERTKVMESMSSESLAIVSAAYDKKTYGSLWPKRIDGVEAAVMQRRFVRHEVKCPGRIFIDAGHFVRMEVLGASLGGFHAHLESQIRFGSLFTINILIGEFEIADLEGWPVWTNGEGLYGFKLATFSTSWKQFIHHSEEEQRKLAG